MKRKVKFILSTFFYYSGFFALIRLLNNLVGRRLSVVTFHRIDKPNGHLQGLASISVTSDNFQFLVRFIKKHYHVLSLQDFWECVRERKTLPPNGILLTFDDGYRGVLEHAVPILTAEDLPAILFVPTVVLDGLDQFWWDDLYISLMRQKNTVSTSDRLTRQYMEQINQIVQSLPEKKAAVIFKLIETLQHCNPELRERVLKRVFAAGLSDPESSKKSQFINWDILDDLEKAGVAIGSHTVSHEFLTSIEGRQVLHELNMSKARLENHLKHPVEAFSYPGGKYNEDAVKMVQACGYGCAFTTDSGINSLKNSRYHLKRINISDDNICGSSGKFSKALTAWHLFVR